MAKAIDYDESLLKQFRIDAKERLTPDKISSNALNGLTNHNSTNRGVMAASHMSQMLVLTNGEEKIVQTGIDHQFGQYTFSIRIKEDCRFIGMVERYRTFHDTRSGIEVVIFVETMEGYFDYYLIPYFSSLYQAFGFQYIYKFSLEDLRKLEKGAFLPEGTILADSPSVKENSGYAFGLNANILLGTLPGQEEDGVIISQSFAEKLNYSTFEKRVIEFGSDKYLLNIYGNDKEYKGFPGIGEMIKEDGRLAALRSYDQELIPALTSVVDLQRSTPEFDKCVYVEPGSKVKVGDKEYDSGVIADIKAYFNHKKKGKNNILQETIGTTEELVEKLRIFYSQILDVYNTCMKPKLKESGSFNVRKDGTLKLSPQLSSLIEDAMVISNHDNRKIAFVNKGNDLDVYYLEFTIHYRHNAVLGSKISDLNGGKGVIVTILPDELMPYDKNGTRAEIIMDPTSIISRSNLGRLYEIYFNAATREAKRQVIEYLNKHPNDINGAFEIVLDFLKIFDNEQYIGYKQCNEEGKKIVIDDIIKNELYIYYSVGSHKPAYEIVLELKKSKYCPLKDKIFIPSEDGKTFVSESEMLIGPLYTILLGKTASDALSSAPDAFLNHYGFSTKTSATSRHNYPWKIATIKFLSETDTRLVASNCGAAGLTLLKDRANSLKTNKNIHKNILEADKPGFMEKVCFRSEAPYGGDAAIILLKNIIRPMGLDIKYVEDPNAILTEESIPHIGFKKRRK